MRSPVTIRASDLDSVPDQPAVFLLWAKEGAPYLARTALLRRRLRRLISERSHVSRLLNLMGVADHIDYWLTGSQLESSLLHLELAQQHFPQDWQRITRLHAPAFVRLTTENPFPRTMVTTRISRGLFYGPFPGRAAAERFESGLLDLFQIRRCEENLLPSPQHPGCIYGEMNRCLRPCQQAVSIHEYRGETMRVEQFLRTGGQSLLEGAQGARDRASSEMQFEEAERQHHRVSRIEEVQQFAGPLARELDELHGVAVTPSVEAEAVELWFLIRGCWREPRRLALSDTAGAGKSMDHRLRGLVGSLDMNPTGTEARSPNPEHLAILVRWYGSSWRDGEWIGFESFDRIPYRKLVNAIGRIAAHARASVPPKR
jgi:excinuclease ABC subunit C